MITRYSYRPRYFYSWEIKLLEERPVIYTEQVNIMVI